MIGRVSDSSQTTLDLIAFGYSLGDRHGRKLLLVLGWVLSVPACLLAAYASRHFSPATSGHIPRA